METDNGDVMMEDADAEDGEISEDEPQVEVSCNLVDVT